MIRRLSLMSSFVLAMSAASAHADFIYGSSGSQIFQYDTVAGGASTLAFSTQGGVTANDLAVNTSGTRFYYSDVSGTTSGLYAYNATTGVQTQFLSTGRTGVQLGSGGVFFGGAYYALIDDPTSLVINKYTFAADGVTLATATTITPAGISSLGDFGDIAINPLTGTLYGSSGNYNGTGQNVFFSLNPALANPAVTVINTAEPDPLQLAFDSQGNLFATSTTTPGTLFRVNLATGALTGGIVNPFGFTALDLAGPVVVTAPVPEPSSVALAAIGLFGVAAARRLRARRSVA